MREIWNWIQIVTTGTKGGLDYFFGGFDGIFFTLVAVSTADYVMGVFRAIFEKKKSNKIGVKGIAKKVAIMILVGVGNMIDSHLLGGGVALRTTILFFYISTEGISLLRNVAAIGLPIPQILETTLTQINRKSEQKTDERIMVDMVDNDGDIEQVQTEKTPKNEQREKNDKQFT